MRVRIPVVAALLLLPIHAFAIIVGELQTGGTTRFTGGAPITVISLSRPSTGIGEVNWATVVWTGATSPCTGSFKLKFVRPNPNGTVTVIAERGAFDSVNGVITMAITPPVILAPGDLIGYTQMRENCGGVANAFSTTDAYLTAELDPPVAQIGNNLFIIGTGVVPSIRASTDPEVVAGYLPVVGSAPGAFGAQFRTAVQLTNRGSSPITGRLVFHRGGVVGQPTDPSVAYSLAPGRTLNLNDAVAATGVTGVGSMDLVTVSGYPPDVTTRIYNDAGAAGTSGFTEDVFTPYMAMEEPMRGTLTVPADLTNFRLNIGVRTLDDGANVTITLFNAEGATIKTLSRTYKANWFEQVPVADFLGGTVPEPNGIIQVQVTDGSMFFYGALTDNRTNDPSIRFPDLF